MQDENGEYLEWCFERGTKTRTGEVAECIDRAFKPKMFATGGARCLVQFYKTYISHRPSSSNQPESPFYLGIKHKRSSDDIVWYIDYPMGKNKLGNLMKTASKVSGIVGKKVTNHSVRKTMIQRLVDSNFTPNVIAQLIHEWSPESKELRQLHVSLRENPEGNVPVFEWEWEWSRAVTCE